MRSFSFLMFVVTAISLSSCRDRAAPFHKILTDTSKNGFLSDNPSLGMGLRSMDGSETGVGILYDTTVRSTDATGGETKAHAELVTSFEDLARKSNLSIDMNFKLYGFKAEGSTNLFKSFKYNTKSQYLYAEVYIETPSKEIIGYRFNNESKKIAEKNINDFYKLYGDEFVYKETRGGSLKLIFEFKSQNSVEEEANNFSLSLTQKFFAGSCTVNTKLSSEYKRIQESTNIKVYIDKQGDYGEMPEFTFEGLAKEFRKFPKTIDPDSGGHEVVTGVKTLRYQYAANKPNTIAQLGVITDRANKYVEALNRRLCKLYESLGNIIYIKTNRLDYEKKTADSLIKYEEKVNEQIQETIDIYNTFKSTYQPQFTPQEIKDKPLSYVNVPNFADDNLPTFQFGANAINTKIFLGKINTSHNTPLKISGQVSFMDAIQPINMLSFDPTFHDAWLQDLINTAPGQLVSLEQYISPRVTPIHIYLNDFNSNYQIKEVLYENENSITIPPGKYYIYVMFDPYGRLILPHAVRPVWLSQEDLIPRKAVVVKFPEDQLFTVSFRN
jgi:hypothetical protein